MHVIIQKEIIHHVSSSSTLHLYLFDALNHFKPERIARELETSTFQETAAGAVTAATVATAVCWAGSAD